jgi:hypothetical protein
LHCAPLFVAVLKTGMRAAICQNEVFRMCEPHRCICLY